MRVWGRPGILLVVRPEPREAVVFVYFKGLQ